MNMAKLRGPLTAAMVVLVSVVLMTTVGQAQTVAQFAPTDCPEIFAELPLTLECGLVNVPIEHDSPEKGTLSLALFRARAIGDHPVADPLVLLQGGPGGSVDSLVFTSLFALTDVW